MTDHPITPPQELVEQWRHQWTEGHGEFGVYLATQAARWGDDQRLEACCEWVSLRCGRWPDGTRPEDELRAAMRPKPPSLKKQACDALDTYVYGNPNSQDKERTYNTIRRALERLAELEGLQDA